MKKSWLLFFVFILFSELAVAARTINSATVDSSSSTTVVAGATISVSLNVTTNGSGNDRHWKSTAWRIASSSGSLTCENHSNNTGSGTYDETFDITAPSSDGTYNVYLVAYKDNSCSSGASTEFELSNAVVVSSSSPPASSSSCVTVPSDYPLYGGDAIKIQDSSIKVNGNTVSTGTYSPEAAIDKTVM